MPHLDEGLIMALLDGELTAAEQREVEGHLRSCAECSERVRELRVVMSESDRLVEELIVPPATVPAVEPRKRARLISARNLAWAASVVAALGLGITGGVMFLDQPGNRENVATATRQTEAPPDQSPPGAEAPSAVINEASPGGESLGQSAGVGDLASNQARRSAERAGSQSDREQEENARAMPTLGATSFDDSSAKLAIPGGRADSAPPAPAPLADAAGREATLDRSVAEMQPQSAPSTSLRLVPRDEVTTRQRLEQVAGANAPTFRPIPMEEAVSHLGGVIRLIDGLAPEEFEVAASDSAQPRVRVIYRVGRAESRLFLEQRRVDNSFMASDLQTRQQAVDQPTQVNRLSWNDLRGFALTLSGPFSVDSLFHFKTLVK